MRNFFLYLVAIVVVSSCKTNYLADVRAVNTEVSDVQPDQDILSLIAPYRDSLDAEMQQPIGILRNRLEKSKPESTLCNWVADRLLEQSQLLTDKKVDIAVANYGGLRVPYLEEGVLTKGEIYELLPFDNMIVIIEMNRSQMEQLLEHMAKAGGWPQSASLRYVIKNDKAEDVSISGAPLADTIYRVALPDYIANGGDDCDFLIELPRLETGVFMRSAVIERIEAMTAAGIPQEGMLDERVLKQ